MKHAATLQSFIQSLARRHSLDLSSPECSLRLEQNGFMPLVIERISENQLSIAHYFSQNGDLIADPEVILFTGCNLWVPIEITQSLGSWQRVAEISADGQRIHSFQPRAQADLASFCRHWARNLRAQGWDELENQASLEDKDLVPQPGRS